MAETVNIAPHDNIYSPHVLKMKLFMQELTAMLNQTDAQTYPSDPTRSIVSWLIAQIDDMREAMSTILSDDIMLIVDGKRLPGRARDD